MGARRRLRRRRKRRYRAVGWDAAADEDVLALEWYGCGLARGDGQWDLAKLHE